MGARDGSPRWEPEMGFEPMTCALRVRCSTTELPGRRWDFTLGEWPQFTPKACEATRVHWLMG